MLIMMTFNSKRFYHYILNSKMQVEWKTQYQKFNKNNFDDLACSSSQILMYLSEVHLQVIP